MSYVVMVSDPQKRIGARYLTARDTWHELLSEAQTYASEHEATAVADAKRYALRLIELSVSCEQVQS